MKDIRITKGSNVFDWFLIPTIRITRSKGIYTYLTIEWLKWYIGISW